MKLINILKRNFILPLSICLVATSLIAVLINIIYSKKYNEEDFQYKIKKGKDQSVSFVVTLVQELLYERFQLVFDYLITAKEVLDKYHSDWDPKDFPDINYFKSYMKNIMEFFRPEDFKDLEENQMLWFIDNLTE